ncbi:dTDP-4-dehydrorhamnose reductase [Parabacteroides faecis]|uniref:dTDP-4-dehydrorhamnose reductase n=1 Tax=Parabacteroides faecis TaxID=1217282 RepID=UPI002164AA7A|nr:dTDP-4-dehydrorhamnose reductase [Parabacteroides faecis]MCS2890223.1 dTDP-4-dehydrorhamnose reductase [Parabacteroides faecis]UVQ49436.1 dTDP-4-dehydrorhamnose reductase [Parabacteroides faecis]
MMKTLIIGANGFTGRRILQSLSRQGIYELTGCSLHEDILPGNNYRFVQADMNNHSAIDRLIAEIRPDVVINGSALSVPDYCESHHEEAYAANVLAVENIARCCEKAGSRFIHLSTDFVFDGKKAELYTETDTPAPVNYYGISKYQGEQAVAANCSNYANVRVVVVYGKALPGQHGNILQLVKNRLQAGQEIRVVSDQYRTPTWVQDIADGVEKLMHISQNGIWHICGDECLSIADIAYRVADYFKLDRSLIVPVTTEEMNEATPRPRFSGLSIEKAKRILGYAPHSLEEGMAEMK